VSKFLALNDGLNKQYSYLKEKAVIAMRINMGQGKS